ncbi:MAG: prepilin-type N-terminal cleavage/methylation domain-containing protein [Coriobacteriia bacterium]|nr:prepilin-type N-terminal cleavage/methylation domain-containing protein [Coriobacteriia bacterium]
MHLAHHEMTRTTRPHDTGFTLVELMVVVLVIGALVSIAIPVFSASRAQAESNTCLATRSVVEGADHQYWIATGRRPGSITALVGDSLKAAPHCPAGGEYVWIDPIGSTAPARTLGCSVHYFPSAPLTALGSSFTEITSNMIKLLNDYYAAHGSWPRSFSPYNYTDLGLSPADWASPAGHLYYSASGSRVSVRPEAGYMIQVKKPDGTLMTLTEGLKWSLWYSALDGKWYYKSIATGQEILISSMVVSAQ